MTEYIDVEVNKDTNTLKEIGFWLDANMPNPPLPETQRWTFGYSQCGTRAGIRFFSKKDAVLFSLRWC